MDLSGFIILSAIQFFYFFYIVASFDGLYTKVERAKVFEQMDSHIMHIASLKPCL